MTTTAPVLAELPFASDPVLARLVDVETRADYDAGPRDLAVVAVDGHRYRVDVEAIQETDDR